MLTRAIATLTTIPFLKLGEFNKCAAIVQKNGARCSPGFSVPLCGLNADIYEKGFFGIRRKFDSNYI
jgi:hypothetical protein